MEQRSKRQRFIDELAYFGLTMMAVFVLLSIPALLDL